MSQADARGPADGEPAVGPEDGGAASHARRQGPKRPLWLAGLAALVTFLALYGAYSRQDSDASAQDSPESAAGLIQQASAAGTSLTAVGRTIGLAEACTAWLLDVGAQPDQQAYAVTTARCVGQSDTATVLADEGIDDARVEFNAFATLTTATQPDLVQAPVEAVEWASVRGSDLAVLRLATSYGELVERGVQPIDAVAALEEGSQILVAGVPVQGIEPNEQYLRGSRCQVAQTSDVLEGGLLRHDSQAAECEGIRGGSWGSPVFNPAGDAVAMVNTTTNGSDVSAACAIGVPCRVAADGAVSVDEGASYLVPVADLASCFPEGTFTLGGQCPLEDPASVLPAKAVPAVSTPGSTVEVQLDGGLPEGFASTADIEVTQGPLGTVDCRAPQGWQSAAGADAAGADGAGGDGASGDPTSPGQWAYPVVLPAEEGFTVVCIGSAAQPTEIVIEAVGAAPDQ
jgi:hypothetical protein